MAPIARGLGFAVVSVGLFLAFYYNVVVSWAIWYLLSSLSSRLEWVHCGHWYNSPSCWSQQDYYYNNTCQTCTSCRSGPLQSVSLGGQ